MNPKDERIYKLWKKGMPASRIARKLGLPENDVGLKRIEDALVRKGAVQRVGP